MLLVNAVYGGAMGLLSVRDAVNPESLRQGLADPGLYPQPFQGWCGAEGCVIAARVWGRGLSQTFLVDV
jgi:hypothetical protein